MTSSKKLLAEKAKQFRKAQPEMVNSCDILLHEMAKYIKKKACITVHGKSYNSLVTISEY